MCDCGCNISVQSRLSISKLEIKISNNQGICHSKKNSYKEKKQRADLFAERLLESDVDTIKPPPTTSTPSVSPTSVEKILPPPSLSKPTPISASPTSVEKILPPPPSLELMENWRAMGNSEEKRCRRSKPSILNPFMDFDRGRGIHDKHLPFLRNFPSYTNLGKTIKATNVCGFDSLSQIFISMYAEVQHITNNFDTTDNIFMQFIASVCSEKLNAQTVDRIGLLKLCYEVVDLSDNLSIIDCLSNISKTFEYFLPRPIALNYACEVHGKYSKVFEIYYVPINYLKLTQQSLKDLQQIFAFPARKCKSCDEYMNMTIQISHGFVAIDCQSINDQSLAINPTEISEKLEIGNDIYYLKGIVSYSPGHYTATIKRGSGLWETYNDLNRFPTSGTKRVNPHLIIYSRA